MATTDNKNYTKPTQASGSVEQFVLQQLLGDLDTELGRFHYETHTLGDDETADLFSGNEKLSFVVVFNSGDDELHTYITGGGGQSVTAGSDSNASANFTTTSGNDTTTNVFHSSGSYTLENKTGGEKTYEVVGFKVA